LQLLGEVEVLFVGKISYAAQAQMGSLPVGGEWLADAAEESFGIGESVIENSDGSIGSEPRS